MSDSYEQMVRVNNTTQVLGLVRMERDWQDTKWGPQSRDVVPSGFATRMYQLRYDAEAKRYQSINDRRSTMGDSQTWDTILLEEVYEALSEVEPRKQIDELIQVAAVAVAIAEDLRCKQGLAAA